ncbi:hypothetical protein LTR56_020395 [Elasticomyces elasticus]|nr:hypothetical protein LTR56_020395 [Elasticomyces elasticus]KAK3633119.1 hypothetical protein LTR22_020317 [Elasticomyces elasticus]KAK4910253.1 hypothetical protein LTR49_021070 [Elasticomyces elasticus]KAK5750006.1 hypothetical protein LTS12_019954 [Elasticomyces elasticus]
MFMHSCLVAGLLASGIAVPVNAVSFADAEAGYHTLQQFYNQSIGLWIPSTGWWNSANCLTVIADLAAIDATVKAQSLSVFSNTFKKAQVYNLQMQKLIGVHSAIDDDEGWWALAWIAAYDVTGNRQYLSTAESIFEDMKAASGTTPCGGTAIWWDKDKTYVNAIANELFLDVAAHLANRGGSKSSYYLSWAKKQWAWFQSSDQGVILGGLTELSKATHDNSYITTAKQIADAAIANLTVNGILHDPCEPDCGADGSQFKGVFARNLQILQQASPEKRYATFLSDNANSIWGNDRVGQSELSLVWSGPYIRPANASTQSSALDAIVGALATS